MADGRMTIRILKLAQGGDSSASRPGHLNQTHNVSIFESPEGQLWTQNPNCPPNGNYTDQLMPALRQDIGTTVWKCELTDRRPDPSTAQSHASLAVQN